MAFVHGKNTFISLNGKDLSAFTTSSELNVKADTHDVTAYGKNSHVYQGGLLDNKASMEGTYDTSVTSGPRGVIKPLVGQTVPLIRRPEGTGSGKPQDLANAVVESYVETSPVADMVKWKCELQLSDDINSTPQP